MLHHVIIAVVRLCRWWLLALLVGITFAGSTLPCGAQAAKTAFAAPATAQPPAAETPKPAPTPPDLNQPIPLPEIADRAEELDALLLDFAKVLSPSSEQVAADTSIQEQAEEISQRARDLDALLASTPSPLELQEEERYWRTLREQYTSFRKLLTSRAAKLQDQVTVLDGKKTQWQATLAQVKTTEGIEAVSARVDRALQEVERNQRQVQTELNRVLNLQTMVSQQDVKISAALGKLSEIRTRLRSRVFERDGPPLWKTQELAFAEDSLVSIAHRSANRGLTAIKEFLRYAWVRLLVIIALYLVALLLSLRFKRDLEMGRFADVPTDAERILGRPYLVALLVALLGTIGQTVAAPPGMLFALYLLYAVVMVRLMPRLTDRRLCPLLYALAVFGLLEGIYLLVQVSPLLRRQLFVAVILAGLLTFAWLIRPSAVRGWKAFGRTQQTIVAVCRIGLLLLAISLLTNLVGFVSLSQIIGLATLLGAFAAVLLYGAVRVLKIMLALALQSWALSLGSRRKELERWCGVVLTIAGAGLWLDTMLYLFAIHGDVAKAVSAALKYPIGFAKVHIIVGDVLNALLVLVGGYVLANVITFVLREFFLAKIDLPRGLPLAISTILYYLLLVVVGFLAVSGLGVELNKFTLITGALGIGVGFGLQTTVSNFVSGLILLFERPIRVGDVVEVAGITGMVRRIGIRSSTIHTSEDSEVIVPNNELISTKVTNWTLSSPRRRVTIPVGVACDSDPATVLKLLAGVAHSTPGVMSHPEPAAFFLGFGESTLDFELRFWATQEMWLQLKSDVGVRVAKALGDAGIEIPFPQRDLHLRSIDEQTRGTLQVASPTSSAEPEKPQPASRAARAK
jgi:potassium-dependent mechanosensitive channel